MILSQCKPLRRYINKMKKKKLSMVIMTTVTDVLNLYNFYIGIQRKSRFKISFCSLLFAS